MVSERMTWAAVTRNDETLLVSYTVWSDALLQAAGIWPEDPIMDEISGTWRVPSASATTVLRAIQETPSKAFERTMGRADLSPSVSASVMRSVLSSSEAEEAKTRLIDFLERGAFNWRFVSV
jgi:hypothetical protein